MNFMWYIPCVKDCKYQVVKKSYVRRGRKKKRSVNDVQQLESRSSGVLCMYVTTATDAEDYSILAEGALRTVMNVKRCPS